MMADVEFLPSASLWAWVWTGDDSLLELTVAGSSSAAPSPGDHRRGWRDYHELVLWLVVVVAALLVLRIVVQVLRCRRACGGDLSQVPERIEPSAEWVTTALRASGALRPSAVIRTVRLHELGGGLSGKAHNGGGLSGTRLVKLQFDVDDGSAATGSEYRVMIDAGIIEDPGVVVGAAPRSAIHKFADYRDQIPRNLCGDGGCMTRLFLWSTGIRPDIALAQEAQFYRDVAPMLREQHRLSLPKVYHVGLEGSYSRISCCFVCGFDCCWPCGCNAGNVDVRSSIIIEDLGARGLSAEYVMSDDTLPVPVMRTAVRMIARLHRWGWLPTGGVGGGRDHATQQIRNSVAEAGLEALVTGQHHYNTNTVTAFGEAPALEKFIEVWSKCNWSAVDRTAGVKPGERTLEWLFLKDRQALAMLRKVRDCGGGADGGKSLTGWAAQSIKLQRDLTLLHGDFHKGNIMYRKQQGDSRHVAQGDWNARYGRATENDAEIVLIDFQFFGVGNPAWELTYFMLLSAVDPKHDDMLLMEYHTHLIELGGAASSYSLDQLRNEMMLTMGTMLVQMISESAHPGKAVELVEQFGSKDTKIKEQAITGHRLMARLVDRLLYYQNAPGWQSNSLLFRPLGSGSASNSGNTGINRPNAQEGQGTPLLDKSTEVGVAQREYASRRYGMYR